MFVRNGKRDLLGGKVTIWYFYDPIYYGDSYSTLYLENTQDKVKGYIAFIFSLGVKKRKKNSLRSPILSAAFFTPNYFIF